VIGGKTQRFLSRPLDGAESHLNVPDPLRSQQNTTVRLFNDSKASVIVWTGAIIDACGKMEP
jgi:hypothetical protein